MNSQTEDDLDQMLAELNAENNRLADEENARLARGEPERRCRRSRKDAEYRLWKRKTRHWQKPLAALWAIVAIAWCWLFVRAGGELFDLRRAFAAAAVTGGMFLGVFVFYGARNRYRGDGITADDIAGALKLSGLVSVATFVSIWLAS